MKSQEQIKASLKDCSKTSQNLSPNKKTRAQWMSQVTKLSERFLEELEKKPAFIKDEDKGNFSFKNISSTPVDMDIIIESFDKELLVSNLNPSSPFFFGYIPGGGMYPCALGDFLAAVTNRYSGVYFANPAASRMEDALLYWMIDVIGLDKQTAWGTLTSGGSSANLIALIAARDKLTYKERESAVVYISSDTHHSIEKALMICGMGHCLVRKINTDIGHKVNCDHLLQLITVDIKNGLIPWLVVSNAGTTNMGTIDPIKDIDCIAKEFKLWHHIDAAYGGFFILANSTKESLNDLHLGDSVTLDPHKGLFTPYGLGAILIKDHRILKKSLMKSADYLQDFTIKNEHRSADHYSLEMTRHFRGPRLWLPLMLFGVDAFSAALEEKHLLALWFHKELSNNPKFQMGPMPQLSVSSFRYISNPDLEIENLNKENLALVEKIIQRGNIFISSTKIGDIVYLRMAILCFRSKLRHVKAALKEIQELTN